MICLLCFSPGFNCYFIVNWASYINYGIYCKNKKKKNNVLELGKLARYEPDTKAVMWFSDERSFGGHRARFWGIKLQYRMQHH